MTKHDDKMESRIPQLGGLKLVLEKVIALLPQSIDLGDFRKIGDRFGFNLEQAISGVVIIKDGEMESITTPIYRDKKNPKRLAIFYYGKSNNVKRKTAFYSARKYNQH